MRGPLPLWPYTVDMSVPANSTGIFCLGQNRSDVEMVLRADADLRNQIRVFFQKYKFFWFETTGSVEERWIAHCRTFHRLLEAGHLTNRSHPSPPAGTYMACVVCGYDALKETGTMPFRT